MYEISEIYNHYLIICSKHSLKIVFTTGQWHINLPLNAEIFLYKPWRSKGYFQSEIIINVQVPASFEYLCYGFTLSVRGSTSDVRI